MAGNIIIAVVGGLIGVVIGYLFAQNKSRLTAGQNSTLADQLKQKENEERYTNTVATLDTIARNRYIQRNTRDLVKEALDVLKDEKGGSIYVRAANVVSMLDSLTQKKRIESHIRTMLWQVVSTVEIIRE